jgi:hypothetical protein
LGLILNQPPAEFSSLYTKRSSSRDLYIQTIRPEPAETPLPRLARYTSFGFLHIIPTCPIDGWNGDSNLPTKTFRQTKRGR